MPEEHKPNLTDGIFQGKVIESLENIKSFMVEVKAALFNLQNTKVDKTELTSYEVRLSNLEGKHESLKDAHDGQYAEIKGGIKVLKWIWVGLGVVWAVVVLVLDRVWK